MHKTKLFLSSGIFLRSTRHERIEIRWCVACSGVWVSNCLELCTFTAAIDFLKSKQVHDVFDTFVLHDTIKVHSLGGNVSREPGPVKGMDSIIAFVKDPNGYAFELIQRGPLDISKWSCAMETVLANQQKHCYEFIQHSSKLEVATTNLTCEDLEEIACSGGGEMRRRRQGGWRRRREEERGGERRREEEEEELQWWAICLEARSDWGERLVVSPGFDLVKRMI
ncbi:hypothetical protein Droror1_Dr00008665 [Drosera rotundifolia]